MNKENKSNDIENKTSFKNFVIYQDFSNAKIPFSNNNNNNYNQDTTNKISDTFSENNNKIRIEIEKNSKNEFSFFQQNKKNHFIIFIFHNNNNFNFQIKQKKRFFQTKRKFTNNPDSKKQRTHSIRICFKIRTEKIKTHFNRTKLH